MSSEHKTNEKNNQIDDKNKKILLSTLIVGLILFVIGAVTFITSFIKIWVGDLSDDLFGIGLIILIISIIPLAIIPIINLLMKKRKSSD